MRRMHSLLSYRRRRIQMLPRDRIERISCITQHEDYSVMTNRSVLSQVARLLRDRNGRGYRRRDGQTQNQ